MSGNYKAPEQLRRGSSVRFVAAVAALTIVGISLYASQRLAQSARAPEQPAQDKGKETGLAQATKAVAAAKAFLESLDAKLGDNAMLDFNSSKKPDWSNLPITMVKRNGVRLGDLSKKQRDAAMELMAAVLSKEGYQKTVDILDADQELVKDGGKGNKLSFGRDNFFLAIFGKPSLTEPWMVQFGGHHLGLNVTVVRNGFVLTPTHTGTQPDVFTRDGKKIRPLGPENDNAFKLMASLDEKQKGQAILSAKPGNLILGPKNDGKTIKPQGLKGSSLTNAQKTMLMDIIGAWVNIVPDDSSAFRMAEIKADLGDTYFAWMGPTTAGSAVYYRIQGPTLVIEYAPQGGTGHIHTVIRDPTNDYGQKLVKK